MTRSIEVVAKAHGGPPLCVCVCVCVCVCEFYAPRIHFNIACYQICYAALYVGRSLSMCVLC